MAGDDATVLVRDETTMRMFPPLRAAWARLGEQADVGISGHDARRTQFGAINVRTGRRIVTIAKRLTQVTFQDFLKVIRRRNRGGEIHVILDGHSAQMSAATRALARRPGIRLHQLPKLSPEFNAVDHLWQHVKEQTAPNRQYDNVDELASRTKHWTLGISARQALKKAGLLAPTSWLRGFSQNYRGPI
jgi:transposase